MTFKRVTAILCMFALAACLTGCMGDYSIDELLSAPTLSPRQSLIADTLKEEFGNHISFVYPSTGRDRSAIRFVDLDYDGTQECIVFYRNNDTSLNASIAVLKASEENGYTVTSTMDGPGDGITEVRFLRQPYNGCRVILIEWSSLNLTTHTASAYYYTENGLEPGFDRKCTDIVVVENDETGSVSFCYTATTASGYYVLYSVQLMGSTSVLQWEIKLNRSTQAIRQLTTGKTKDGTLIFVDELTDSGLRTEIIRCSDSAQLTDAVSSEGHDSYGLSKRADASYLLSRELFGIMCYPSSVAPDAATLSPNSWTYWYSVSDGKPYLALAGKSDTDYSYFLSIPTEWLANADTVISEDAPGSVLIRDKASDKALVTLAVLSVGDDAAGFASQGYKFITGNGAFRYYALFNCSDSDEQYIINHFFTI